MNKNNLYFLLLLTFLIIGCKEKNELNQGGGNTNFLLTDQLVIEVNNDTVLQNEYVKGIVRLMDPKFPNKNSKITLVLEDSLDILKPDLSNEKETVLMIFHNLEYDSINYQYFKNYDRKKTAAFGKMMRKKGSQKIRGYVMEYYGFELGPHYDITSDSLAKQRNKIYFEKEIIVVPN